MKKIFNAAFIFAVLAIVIASTSGVALASPQPTAGGGVPNLAATAASPPVPPGATVIPTNTQTPNGFDCTILGSDPCSGIVNFILVVVKGAMGLLIAMGAFLIEVGLTLTTTVYSSQATQSGFGVTLSIANLGFVLGIIVIALATILHRETFGWKKSLWRLIVMAILVNFGLVITAPIVGFANGMTNYFVSSVAGATSYSSGTTGIVTFSGQLMQQTNAAALQNIVPTSTAASAGISVAGGVFQTIFSLIFIIIFEGLIALTFLLLGALLFVRYIFLVVLLVMLPLAWVAWIFPNFKHQFDEWWKKFIQWTFFPPAALFFVWLAMTIQKNFATNVVNNPNGPGAAIMAAIGQGQIAANAVTGGTNATSVLAQVVNSMVVIAIMIGGLMASSKMAGKAGEFAVAQGKAVSGAIQGYVGRRTKQLGKRVATAPLRTQPVKNLATRLQQRSDVKALRWTGANWLGRKAGQALEAGAVAGGSKNVDASGERFKKMTADQRLNRLSGAEWENAPAQRMALLKQVLEDKNVKKLSTDEMDRYFGEGKENEFKRFGQEKLYKDLREKSGLGLRDLDKKIAELEVSDPKSELADKQAEKKKMLAAYIEDNTDDAVEVFTDPKKLEEKRNAAQKTGRVPASLEEESLNRMQKNITEGIADGLSPSNISSLIKALAKKNNLDTFQSAVGRHNSPGIQIKLADNDKVLNWNDKQVARGALDVDLRDVYGLPKKKDSDGPSRIILPSDVPPKEPRSRTTL